MTKSVYVVTSKDLTSDNKIVVLSCFIAFRAACSFVSDLYKSKGVDFEAGKGVVYCKLPNGLVVAEIIKSGLNEDII